MAEFKKSYGVMLACLAVALTFLGVALAATETPNPSGIAKDTLSLHGNPPRSASPAREGIQRTVLRRVGDDQRELRHVAGRRRIDAVPAAVHPDVGRVPSRR